MRPYDCGKAERKIREVILLSKNQTPEKISDVCFFYCLFKSFFYIFQIFADRKVLRAVAFTNAADFQLIHKNGSCSSSLWIKGIRVICWSVHKHPGHTAKSASRRSLSRSSLRDNGARYQNTGSRAKDKGQPSFWLSIPPKPEKS